MSDINLSPSQKEDAILESFFMTAVYDKDLPRLKEILKKHPHKKDKLLGLKEASTGNSLLHIAVINNDIKMVGFLTLANININQKNHDKETALSLAVKDLNFKMVFLLIEKGAKIPKDLIDFMADKIKNGKAEIRRIKTLLVLQDQMKHLLKAAYGPDKDATTAQIIPSPVHLPKQVAKHKSEKPDVNGKQR